MDNAAKRPGHAVLEKNGAQTRRLVGHSADDLRAHNRQLILKYLRDHGPTPRVVIAKSLGLSRSTVSNIVSELIEDGLVREGGRVSTSLKGGKPATLVYFNDAAGYIVGIDLGRSRTRVYLTNLDTKIIKRSSAVFDIKVGWEGVLQFLVDIVDKLVKMSLGNWTLVRGIGLGVPGTLDPARHRLISPPLFASWSKVDIPTYLRQQLHLDKDFPIYLDKDANMGALGESRYGKGRDIENLIYVKLSTGISAGLILNGHLYRGNNGVAGEFGHVLFNEESLPCASCGKQGCLEAVAGLSAIVEDAHRGAAPLPSQHSEEDATSESMADVVIEANKGNAACRAALTRAGGHIGKALGSYLINVYNPSVLLLDGGIVRPSKGGTVYINKLLLRSLRQHAKDSSLPAAWTGTRILTGGLGDDAVGLGAVATVIEKDPELSLPN